MGTGYRLEHGGQHRENTHCRQRVAEQGKRGVSIRESLRNDARGDHSSDQQAWAECFGCEWAMELGRHVNAHARAVSPNSSGTSRIPVEMEPAEHRARDIERAAKQ